MEAAAADSLKVTRTFKASRQRVFRAWTEPELMMRWFVEGDGNMSVCDIDLREGGQYRLEGEMGGKRWRIWGSYLEVKPPEKLVYTWAWKHDPGVGKTPEGDTTVTVGPRTVLTAGQTAPFDAPGVSAVRKGKPIPSGYRLIGREVSGGGAGVDHELPAVAGERLGQGEAQSPGCSGDHCGCRHASTLPRGGGDRIGPRTGSASDHGPRTVG